MAYIGSKPTYMQAKDREVFTFTSPSTGTTTFSGNDDAGRRLAYNTVSGATEVFVNGVMLNSADFTATSGTSIVLATATFANDLVTVITYNVIPQSDTVSKTAGGTFQNNIQIDAAYPELKLSSNTNSGNNLAFTQGTNSYLTASNNVYMSANGNSDMFNLVNGSVGLNNTSPQRQFHIGAADNTNHEAVIVLNNGGATGYRAGIEWRYENITTPRARISVNASDQDIEFDTAGIKRMEIDADGNVTKPYQPAFLISNATAWSWGQTHASTDADINYYSPWPIPGAVTFYKNIGNHATLTTHPETGSYNLLKFTAPVAGFYNFGIQGNIVIEVDNDYHALGLVKNSTTAAATGDLNYYFFQIQRSGTVAANNFNHSGDAVVWMDANDYIVFYARSAAYIRMTANYWHVYGYLIG